MSNDLFVLLSVMIRFLIVLYRVAYSSLYQWIIYDHQEGLTLNIIWLWANGLGTLGVAGEWLSYVVQVITTGEV